MNLITELRREKRLYGTCPRCGEEFRVSSANIFDLKDEFPAEALTRIAEVKQELKEAREDIRASKHRMTSRAEITVESVNLGKILEKIAPSFDGFHYQTRDCRSLFDPIDYVIFSGLAKTGEVDSPVFLDVKSGGARLTRTQKEINDVVQRGNVEFDVIPARSEEGK
jgi:predicted Holliday junction resolvase-like endonuclease